MRKRAGTYGGGGKDTRRQGEKEEESIKRSRQELMGRRQGHQDFRRQGEKEEHANEDEAGMDSEEARTPGGRVRKRNQAQRGVGRN